MYNFDEPRYEKVLSDAIALREQIEKAADEISKKGYSNIMFIGCGGTYSHSLPVKLMLDTYSEIESYSLIAAEFMAMPPKKFSDKSVCVFSTRSGNTKELVAAAKFCKEAGATVVCTYPTGTPRANTQTICSTALRRTTTWPRRSTGKLRFVARMMYNKGCFEDYAAFADGLASSRRICLRPRSSTRRRAKQSPSATRTRITT